MYARILCAVAAVAVALIPQQAASSSQQGEEQTVRDFYGLYYVDWDNRPIGLVALVISPDGQPIPPKENDPDAPTQPGFHIGQQRFPFAWSRFSSQGFSFRTVRVGETKFSFRGRFRREQVASISGVPYLAGMLVEIRNGRIVKSKRVHFSHAAVL